MVNNLEELLDRVRAAQGPDRALDVYIVTNLDPDRLSSSWSTAEKLRENPFLDDDNMPPVTASIDAALALTERVLPGWKYNIGHDANDELHATVWHGVEEFDEYGASAPIAILAATLAALIAKEAVE